ncbi:hypothetical protein P171DRAFT_449834 [Karstenula rhodostoma CBS 690.94]|uniref:Uncharacterized protein n=1 Tax=Karstenula rhodostoma CBS 690.94 TaxID=1392251 RepID=A0A9P4P553_9PLEO|nr:hypothetical protein P171DRAFT_449834 [Karstenula rhodostoma CBS 690.94]
MGSDVGDRSCAQFVGVRQQACAHHPLHKTHCNVEYLREAVHTFVIFLSSPRSSSQISNGQASQSRQLLIRGLARLRHLLLDSAAQPTSTTPPALANHLSKRSALAMPVLQQRGQRARTIERITRATLLIEGVWGAQFRQDLAQRGIHVPRPEFVSKHFIEKLSTLARRYTIDDFVSAVAPYLAARRNPGQALDNWHLEPQGLRTLQVRDLTLLTEARRGSENASVVQRPRPGLRRSTPPSPEAARRLEQPLEDVIESASEAEAEARRGRQSTAAATKRSSRRSPRLSPATARRLEQPPEDVAESESEAEAEAGRGRRITAPTAQRPRPSLSRRSAPPSPETARRPEEPLEDLAEPTFESEVDASTVQQTDLLSRPSQRSSLGSNLHRHSRSFVEYPEDESDLASNLGDENSEPVRPPFSDGGDPVRSDPILASMPHVPEQPLSIVTGGMSTHGLQGLYPAIDRFAQQLDTDIAKHTVSRHEVTALEIQLAKMEAPQHIAPAKLDRAGRKRRLAELFAAESELDDQIERKKAERNSMRRAEKEHRQALEEGRTRAKSAIDLLAMKLKQIEDALGGGGGGGGDDGADGSESAT